MSKLIYKPTQFYKSDINDLVEEELNKGGPGSGQKGHKTIKDRLLGHKYKVESEDATHYHAVDKHGEKVKVNRTQADEVKDDSNKRTEPQKMKDARHGIKREPEDSRTEAQKMADARRGPGFKRDWK